MGVRRNCLPGPEERLWKVDRPTPGMGLSMVASYCAFDPRADPGERFGATVVPSEARPTEKKETCDWCDADR